jgi:hypothetical protein
MTINLNPLVTKIYGVIIGMVLFFSLGIAMSHASSTAAQHTAPVISKTINVSGLVGVCQIRHCV